ncbi:TPA: hypothetical protein RSW61_001920 [Vibrio harveyi]|nr:hypothetical protein [Vibrio harveyi]
MIMNNQTPQQLMKSMKRPPQSVPNPYEVIPVNKMLMEMRQMVGLEEKPTVPENPFSTRIPSQQTQPSNQESIWKPIQSSASERAKKEKKEQEAADKFQNSSITKSLGLDESFFNALLDEVDNPDTPFSMEDARKYGKQYVTDKIGSMSSKDFKGGF